MCDYEFENYLVYRSEIKRLKTELENRHYVATVVCFVLLTVVIFAFLAFTMRDTQHKEIEMWKAKYYEAVKKLEAERSSECPQ